MKLKIASLFVLCFISCSLFAQHVSYSRIDSIPVTQNGIWLKSPWAGGLNNPLFSEIDLNGDGISDLFAFDKSNGRIEFFINGGTPDSIDYKFTSVYFNNFPYLHDWVLLRDYNCDGKTDIFALSDINNSGIKVYKNISSGGTLQFQLVTPLLTTVKNSVTIPFPSSSIIYPAPIDVDNDGDMDILSLSACSPRTVDYYKNMSEEKGWGCDSLAFQFENGSWGNFQLCTSNQVCTWNTPNLCTLGRYASDYDPSSAAPRDDSETNIFAFDDNGDGAKDLLIGDIAASNSLLIVNGGTPDSANMVSQDINFPSYDTPVNLPGFTNHAYIDVNNDGKKDLLVSCSNISDINCVLYYKNDSTSAAPRFSYQSNSLLQDQMIDVGEGCYPVFFDYDGDGLMDIVIANKYYNPPPVNLGNSPSLGLYKNIGTATSPAFQLIDLDFANISELNGLTGPIYPAFGDLDGDGNKDLLLGREDGTLIYFKNTAPSGQPADFQYTTANYFGIDVGNCSTPQLIDLDHDGLLDLVIGNQNGYLKYYRNTGTSTAPNFSSTPTIDLLGKANTRDTTTLSGFSVPFICSDSAGKYEMFLAGQQGYVLHYNNIENNLNGTFTLTDTIINLSEGQQLSVAGADINNDGKIDLIIGNYAGGAGIFSQSLPLGVLTFTETKPSFEVSPNPAASLLAVHIYDLNETNARLNIFDMLGRNVKNTFVNSTSMNLDISYLSNGIYIIALQTEKFHVTRKLIIQH